MTGWVLIASSHAITTVPIVATFVYILFPRKVIR